MEAVRSSPALMRPDFSLTTAREDISRSEWVTLGVVESVDVAERRTHFYEDAVVEEPREGGGQTEVMLGVEIQLADECYVKHPEGRDAGPVASAIFVPIEYYYEDWNEDDIEQWAEVPASELRDSLISSAPVGARVLVPVEDEWKDVLEPSPYSFFVENDEGVGVGYMDSDDFTELVELAGEEC